MIINSRYTRAFSFALAGLILLAGAAFAKQDYSLFKGFDERAAIEPSADEIEGFPEESLVVLRGNARVIYKDNTIRADEIVLDLREGEIRANRNVVIWSEGEELRGERLVYDLKTNKAGLASSHWHSGGYTVRGEQTEVEHKTGTIEVRNSWITSCDMIEPHYHLKNERSKIVLGQRFWTYNTLFYLGSLPVMYLPVFSRSLRDDWKGHVMGYNYSSDRGVAILNKYNLHFDPMRRLALYADWYPSYGYGFGIKESYHRKGGRPMDGKIYLYRLNLSDKDEDLDVTRRYKIAGEHRQELYDDLVLTAKYQKITDREYNEDLDSEEMFRGWDRRDLQSNRNSFLNLAYTKPDYNLRLLVKENLNDFQLGELMEDERSPQLRLDERRQLVPYLPVYRKVHLDYSRLRAMQEFSLEEDDVWWRRYDELDRLDFGMDLEAPFTVFQWLRITPFTGYQGIFYGSPEQRWSLRNIHGHRFDVNDPADSRDRDFLQRYGDRYYFAGGIRPDWEFDSNWDDVMQNVWKLGTEFSTRMVQPLGSTRRFSQMRLVVEPTVTVVGYFASKDLDDEVPREFMNQTFYPTIPEIDEVDNYRRSARIVRTGLDLKLEGKDYDHVTHRLAKLSLYAAKDFYDDDDHDGEYEDLLMELALTPNKFLEFRHFWRYDLDEGETVAMWDGLTIIPDERMKFTVGYSQFKDTHNSIAEESYATFDMKLAMSKKWTMELRERYDLERSMSSDTRCSFIRDLHDWEAAFSVRNRRRLYRDDDFQVTFGMQFKLPGQLPGGFPLADRYTR